MKKYTEKQIESFKEMINNSIISQIDEDCQLCRKIAKDIHEMEKGYYTFDNISANEIVNEWKERGEAWDLLSKIIENETEKEKYRLMEYLSIRYEKYFPEIVINRRSMIKLLHMQGYATKEDIIKELNEIL